MCFKLVCQIPSKKGKVSSGNIGLKIDGEFSFNKLQVAEKFNSFYTTVASKLVERLPQGLTSLVPGREAQLVTCLATDESSTADPGVASSIPPRSHTLMEIDHKIISTVILLPSTESFKKGCCQLQAKVCARSTG